MTIRWVMIFKINFLLTFVALTHAIKATICACCQIFAFVDIGKIMLQFIEIKYGN